MFKTSEQTDQIDDALAKAQSKVENALKQKMNPAFKSKYADLASHWEACREALTEAGLSLTQWPVHNDDDRLHLVTRIGFKGQWIMSEMSLPIVKRDPQGMGSAISYARRYALAAALGITTEDDDGNAASGRGLSGAPPAIPPKAPNPLTVPAKPKTEGFKTPVISQPQVARFHVLKSKAGMSDEQAKEILKSFGYESTKDILMKDYEIICNKIEGK